MSLLMLPFWSRYLAVTRSVSLTVDFTTLFAYWPRGLILTSISLVVYAGLSLLRFCDLLQGNHAILRNCPIAAHVRLFSERIRSEMRQYFFAGDEDGLPFSRDKRSIVYQRAKKTLEKRPFGAQYEVCRDSFEWLTHSVVPKPTSREPLRTTIGRPDFKQPYNASVLNISGMSFGTFSPNAVRALNGGAEMGNFAHAIGCWSVSRRRTEFNGYRVWLIGSGNFGCRNEDRSFLDERFADTAKLDQIKMIEI